MKVFKRWTLRLLALILILIIILVALLLKPGLMYSHRTEMGKFTVFHEKPLPAEFAGRLGQARRLLVMSELFDTSLVADVCMKDGSRYPSLVTKIIGKDFLSSFANKIVFTGAENKFDSNYIVLDGHRWNLTEMMAHALVHCLQFKRYGLWKSNPVAGYPEWKWEGYPEYIARGLYGPVHLREGIAKLVEAERRGEYWILMADSTKVLTHFQKWRLMIQYCLEEKKMSYGELLKDKNTEEAVKGEMMGWYGGR